MKAEKICVSLETAKRLHEAGIIVDSYYHWVSSIYVSEEDSIKYPDLVHTESDIGQYYCADHKGQPAFVLLQTSDSNCHSIINLDYEPVRFDYPAPTAEELWSILPHRIDVDRCSYRLKLYKLFDDDILAEYEFNYTTPYYVSEDNKLCETLAKLAIKLKEAGYELNKFDK